MTSFSKHQGPTGAISMAAVHSGGVAKRCSGEFDFVRHNHRSSLMLLDAPESLEADVVRLKVRDGSREPDLVKSKINMDPAPQLPRQPGLGRRAVTQVT